jgi:hypothetical protein
MLQAEPGTQERQGRSLSRWRSPARKTVLAVALAVIGLVVTATGSYGLGWKWTGFEGNKLWDWMHLLLVPVVLAAQPLWALTRRLQLEWRYLILALLAACTVVIVGGYALDWTWTGFAGKELWDWLNLIVLPVVLGLSGLWVRRGRPPRHWRPVAAILAVALVVVAVGGYQFDWTWTGFQGNKLWDWLNLLVLPFAVPVAFIWIGVQLEDASKRDEAAPPSE